MYLLSCDCSVCSASTLHVKVKVTDDNDNRPRFSQSLYKFQVSELAAVGDFVGHVTATDADMTQLNAQVSYWLQNVPDLPFAINSVTGLLLHAHTNTLCYLYILHYSISCFYLIYSVSNS